MRTLTQAPSPTWGVVKALEPGSKDSPRTRFCFHQGEEEEEGARESCLGRWSCAGTKRLP